ncbi:hypothetical protein [Nocardia brasiliensis]|uniref:hypothetical protein n=1 Tax=Nocardia brasiliensis TaxID=37326 RepID=UPI0024548CCC|nr:hypothetical protein [Nocardia brasiliensis]
MDIQAQAQAAQQRVESALAEATQLRERLSTGIEALTRMRVRRPSPDDQVVPEVDGMGRLTGLWLAPGLTTRMSAEDLGAAITDAIRTSHADAAARREQINRFVGGTKESLDFGPV